MALAIACCLTLEACDEKNPIDDNPEENVDPKDQDPKDVDKPENPDDQDFSEIPFVWSEDETLDAGLAVEEFKELDGDVTNPERGFYYPCYLPMSNPNLSVNTVKGQRKQGRTILYTEYKLDKCMDSDIPESLLTAIQNNFDALREGGAKCVLRFCYKDNEATSNKPWDAEEQWVMRHIEQIKPLLQKNEDVIMLFQAGYVGVWGEWYYTDHFGMNPRTSDDYLPRKRVLDAMLEALPASRQVAVRTPDFKMHMYGLSLADTLTAQTAHDGSSVSRIGGYNDCFGASADDYGTFTGNNSRPFWKGDTKYTFMGGETCAVSDYCKCKASIKDMEDYHWSYLNIDYNTSVLSRWRKDGCFEQILRRLGYRIIIGKVKHTATPQVGEPYKVVLYLRNSGFAAFMNPRDAKLVFVADNGEKSTFDLGSDPRTWQPGGYRIETSFILPAAKGTLYLHLADPLLPERPEFSAALANEGVWDAATGYNKLLEIK